MGSDACSIESLATFEVSMWANGRLETSKGGKGMIFFFATHLPRRGCTKKDSILSSFLGGARGVA